jgi:hypothetical protein
MGDLISQAYFECDKYFEDDSCRGGERRARVLH